MSHQYLIFDKFPKLVEKSNFSLSLLLFLFSTLLINIVAFLNRQLWIKALIGMTDWCHSGTSTLDYIFINTKRQIVVWEHLKLTKSKCPSSEGRTSTYYCLLNALYATVCHMYWESGSKLLVWRQKCCEKGRFDLILSLRRTINTSIRSKQQYNHAKHVKTNVLAILVEFTILDWF